MLYKCIIVDDEELARELIETYLSRLDNFELIASCASAIEAHKILQNKKIDLIFMDIEMPILNGIDFIKSIKIVPQVIFTTAYRDYAIEGFELNAIDYLLKPIVFERFFKAIEKFLVQNKPNNLIEKKESIYIKINKKNIKIVLNDILYLESVKDYIRIHFNKETMMFKNGITTFQQKLDKRFIRVHRSFIVNSNKVTAYTKSDIEIGNIEIPIGDFYKKEALINLRKTSN